MKKLIILLSVCFAEYGYSQSDSLFQYFPHKVGSTWKYQIFDGTQNRFVRIWLNNVLKTFPSKHYLLQFRLHHEDDPNSESYSQGDVEIDSSNLVAHLLIDPINPPIIDSFACKSGDIFGDSLRCDSIRSELVLGKATTVKYLSSLKPENKSQYKIAWGFGNIEGAKNSFIIGFPQSSPYKMTYAFINGIHYGQALSNKQQDSLLQYHPFQKGNIWVFREKKYERISQDSIVVLSEKLVSKVITGDTAIDGRYYSIFNGTELQRFDSTGGNIVAVDPNYRKEFIIDSLTCSNGSNNNRGITYAYTSFQKDTILGLITPIRQINISPNVDYWSTYKYSLKLGLVRIYRGGYSPNFSISDLVYAKINGKEYGVNPQKQLRDSLLQFYPLQIGNRWIYKIDTTNLYFIETIQKDTIMNNNERYFLRVKEKKNLLSGALLSLGFFYERIDTNTLQLFNFSGVYEMRMDSLLSKKGDTSSFKTIYVNNGSENIFGTERVFRTIKIPFPPFETILKYSHGIGITQRTENAYYDEYPFSLYSSSKYNIVYAKVNGMEFGLNPLSVEKEHNTIPTTFSLSQNYPNPFNPATIIRFSIKNFGFVSLKIYDVVGREVAMLVQEQLQPGNYSTEWNASALPSGMYFYTIKSGTFQETKKAIIIK